MIAKNKKFLNFEDMNFNELSMIKDPSNQDNTVIEREQKSDSSFSLDLIKKLQDVEVNSYKQQKKLNIQPGNSFFEDQDNMYYNDDEDDEEA